MGQGQEGDANKFALAYNGGCVYGSLNGKGTVSSFSGITLPMGLASLDLGGNPSGEDCLNGWLRRVTYYPFAPDPFASSVRPSNEAGLSYDRGQE